MGRLAGIVLALACVGTLTHGETAFSMEEADGAIATAEQHIVQEQSHIIETLNKKLAQMKSELEMDNKRISDLEKENAGLTDTVGKDRELLQQTRDTALANQETLQGVITKQKEKMHMNKDLLQKERKRKDALKNDLAHAKEQMNQVQRDAESSKDKYATLLTQKKEAIQRAKEIKEKKAKAMSRNQESSHHHSGGANPKIPLKPKYLSMQHLDANHHNAPTAPSPTRRQNFLQSQAGAQVGAHADKVRPRYVPKRPVAWGPAPNRESMF